MTPEQLRSARRATRLTQVQAAMKLGLSQPYLSQLESGRRPVTPDLARAVARVFHLRPTSLPVPVEPKPRSSGAGRFARLLGGLGYPGYSHLQASSKPLNPAEVVLDALSQDNLDARVTAALPWVLLHYSDLDWAWLVRNVKLRNLQNRLGFLAALSLEAAEQRPEVAPVPSSLARVTQELELARLAAETTLCRESMPHAERQWLVDRRSALARHWNLLTSLTGEHLPHVP